MADDQLGIETELGTAFAGLTEEYIIKLFQDWSIRVVKWLNLARRYVDRNKDVLLKLTSSAQHVLNKSTKDLDTTVLANLLKQKKIAGNLIENSAKVLEDGYRLLNEIGETVRGEPLLYSVTVTETGAAISSGYSSTGNVITVQVPLEKFLSFVSFSSYRMVLRSPTAIYKMIMSQITDKDNKENIKYEQWSEEKIQQYQWFANQARGVLTKWNNINEGNVLEAFLRFLSIGQSPVKYTEDAKYWYLLASSVKHTMSAPDPFWVGGDIANVQVKGLNASVTNLGSLITTLTDFLNIIMHNKISYEIIKPYIKSQMLPLLEKQSNDTMITTANELLKLFSSTVNRDIKVSNQGKF